ncbi:hypothetical protein KM043_006552 [Ampulex compressa]|nr:hypothetical protein KM043_006552 [Ampulex compressa]
MERLADTGKIKLSRIHRPPGETAGHNRGPEIELNGAERNLSLEEEKCQQEVGGRSFAPCHLAARKSDLPPLPPPFRSPRFADSPATPTTAQGDSGMRGRAKGDAFERDIIARLLIDFCQAAFCAHLAAYLSSFIGANDPPYLA